MANTRKSNPAPTIRLKKKNYERLCKDSAEKGIPLITILNQILDNYYLEKNESN